MNARELRYVAYIGLMILLLAVLLITLPGCARYKVTINPDGSGSLDILSWRKFPDGLETRYKDFYFKANSVGGGLSMEDVFGLARYLEEKGIPLAPTGERNE